MKIAVFYFSGTGNTKFVVRKICGALDRLCVTEIYDITAENADFTQAMKESDLFLIAFPIYGGAPPIPMREFVKKYSSCFRNKNVAIAETQFFFSGDGAASLGRAIEGYGGKVIAAEHFNMPNNLADCKPFPVKNGREIKKTLQMAQKRAEKFARKLSDGKGHRRGFSPLPHAVGYYCQRKYWRKGEAEKRGRLKVDPALCVGCRTCVKQCPVSNLAAENGKAKPLGKCVFCYRCVNLCPKKAITLIGNEPPKVQYRGPFFTES